MSGKKSKSPPFVRFSITLPPDLAESLERRITEQLLAPLESGRRHGWRSWIIQQAVREYLISSRSKRRKDTK